MLLSAHKVTKMKNRIRSKKHESPLISHRRTRSMKNANPVLGLSLKKTPQTDLGIVRAIMRGYGLRKACYNPYTPRTLNYRLCTSGKPIDLPIKPVFGVGFSKINPDYDWWLPAIFINRSAFKAPSQIPQVPKEKQRPWWWPVR